MVRTLLIRGMLVGLVAGFLALGFAEVFGEPQVDHAITFESQRARAAGEPTESALVSRDTQQTAGLAVAVGLYAIAFGGFFALAFAVAYGRLGRLSARATAALVAAGGFVAVVLVPFLKYPANPPAIGNPDTLDRRTALYFAMIAISVLTTILAVRLGRQLAPHVGGWNAALIGGCTFLVVTATVWFVLPAVNEVPTDFPATVLWRFRLSSLGTQLVLWTAMGLLFGVLTERSRKTARAMGPRPASEPTAL